MQAFSLSEASYPEWFRVSASVAAGQDLNPLITEPLAQWASRATDNSETAEENFPRPASRPRAVEESVNTQLCSLKDNQTQSFFGSRWDFLSASLLYVLNASRLIAWRDNICPSVIGRCLTPDRRRSRTLLDLHTKRLELFTCTANFWFRLAG